MKKILLLAIAVLGFSSIARADGFVVFATRAAQNPTDFIDWSQLGVAGTVLTTPQLVTTFNGNSALVGNTNGSSFNRVDEGSGWVGSFDFGETLIWTGNPAFSGNGPGPFATVLLTNPVGSFGFGIQANLFGPFTATVSAYDSLNNLLFTDTFNGPCATPDPVCNASENGSELFIGMGDTTGVNISYFTIGTDSGPGNSLFANDFAINDPSFTYTTSQVPEPSSILLLGSGLLGLVGIRRRKSNI